MEPVLQLNHGRSSLHERIGLHALEAGKMDLYLESFDLDTLIDEVAATIQPMVTKSS